MAEIDAAWVHAHAAKLDREIQRTLLAMCQAPRVAPRLLGRVLVPWRMRRQLLVIIQMRPDCSLSQCRALADELASEGSTRCCILEIVRSVSAELPASRVVSLAEDERVVRIAYDRQVRAFMDTATPTVLVNRVWEQELTGKGVTVAVIDTGLFPHPDFTQPENRIAAFVDLVNDRTQPYDDNGHGTHVAGILAGNGWLSGGLYRGVAPDARLIGIKVLDAYGSGVLSDVIRGVEWCVRNKERWGLRVINLSLGATAQDSYRSDPLCQAVQAAWQHGIVVCVAAGNEGPDPETIATPGIHPRVITVGASDDRGSADRRDDTVARFSSRGPTIDGFHKPDLLAPGVDITATAARRSVLSMDRGRWRGDYTTLSGTSMATPVCAGIAALLLESEPMLRPDDVKERLMQTADSLGLPRDVQGAGLINAQRAIGGRTIWRSRSATDVTGRTAATGGSGADRETEGSSWTGGDNAARAASESDTDKGQGRNGGNGNG